MASIEDEPIRLEAPTPYVLRHLPLRQETPLPSPFELRESVIATLANRHSAEVFTPIATSELATWLHYTTSVQAVNSEDPNRQRRYVASFGALHPAHIHWVWQRHDVQPHRVEKFKTIQRSAHFEEKVRDVIGLYLDLCQNVRCCCA